MYYIGKIIEANITVYTKDNIHDINTFMFLIIHKVTAMGLYHKFHHQIKSRANLIMVLPLWALPIKTNKEWPIISNWNPSADMASDHSTIAIYIVSSLMTRGGHVYYSHPKANGRNYLFEK